MEELSMARFTLPRDLYHGKGALEQLKTLEGKKAMICVGGSSMQKFGFLDRAEQYLKAVSYTHLDVYKRQDIMGADFYRVVDMMHDRLKCNAVPIQLPIGSEDTFKGIIDLVEMKALSLIHI